MSHWDRPGAIRHMESIQISDEECEWRSYLGIRVRRTDVRVTQMTETRT